MAKDYSKINNIVVFDWETGGLTCQKNPVTEFAGLIIDTVTLESIAAYDNLVKPYDPALVYEARAMEITGLSKEKCEKEGIPLKQLGEDLCQLFETANKGRGKNFKCYLIAHNSSFDIPFLQDVCRRCNIDLSKYVAGYKDCWGNFQPYSDDTIIECKKIEGPETESDWKFNLDSCCSRAGINLNDAHRAMNDVVALADLVVHNIKRMRSVGTSTHVASDGAAVGSSHRVVFPW
jgi:DNA polymerase III epsilon subunit-like protein